MALGNATLWARMVNVRSTAVLDNMVLRSKMVPITIHQNFSRAPISLEHLQDLLSHTWSRLSHLTIIEHADTPAVSFALESGLLRNSAPQLVYLSLKSCKHSSLSEDQLLGNEPSLRTLSLQNIHLPCVIPEAFRSLTALVLCFALPLQESPELSHTGRLYSICTLLLGLPELRLLCVQDTPAIDEGGPSPPLPLVPTFIPNIEALELTVTMRGWVTLFRKLRFPSLRCITVLNVFPSSEIAHAAEFVDALLQDGMSLPRVSAKALRLEVHSPRFNVMQWRYSLTGQDRSPLFILTLYNVEESPIPADLVDSITLRLPKARIKSLLLGFHPRVAIDDAEKVLAPYRDLTDVTDLTIHGRLDHFLAIVEVIAPGPHRDANAEMDDLTELELDVPLSDAETTDDVALPFPKLRQVRLIAVVSDAISAERQRECLEKSLSLLERRKPGRDQASCLRVLIVDKSTRDMLESMKNCHPNIVCKEVPGLS